MSGKRIVKEANRYYPEYYKEKWFFGIFGGYWSRFKVDELLLGGYFTELRTCDLSYPNLEMAKDYLKKETKEILES